MAPISTSNPSNLDRLIYEKTSPYAVAPERASDDSAGYILCSAEDAIKIVKPNERVAITTGLSFMFPPGCYGRICGRFATELYRRFSVLSTVIDPQPQGSEAQVLIHNSSDSPVEIHPGDRICLLILERYYIAELEEYVPVKSSEPEGYTPVKIIDPPPLCSENLMASEDDGGQGVEDE